MNDFGAAVRRLMAERGLSQNQLAGLSHWDAGYLSKVLNGRKPGTHALAADLDRALGADAELLGVWTAVHGSPALAALASPARTTDVPGAAAGVLTRWDAVHEPAAASVLTPGQAGPGEISHFEDTAGMFRTWDHERGGGLGRQAATGQLADVAELIGRPHPAPLRRRLLSVASMLALTIASMSADSGDTAAAYRYLGAALVPAGAVIAVDELTGAMRRIQHRLFPGGLVDAGRIISEAKATKTADELACMRRALRITEEAIAEVERAMAPGVRQVDLSGRFVRRAFELGATANVLDPIWQVMPPSRAEGVWTIHGDLALPLLTTERELIRGDVLWVDVSISWGGYCSDFGRTWVVGQDPSPRQRAQFRRWTEIVDAVHAVTRAGATGADLTKAAIEAHGDGTRPWVKHFYLGHGLGVDAAEMPFVGTDLGDQFDQGLVLEAGNILVLEPIVWDDGTGGYRAEEVMLITDDGYIMLSDYPYTPYGD